MSLSFKKRKRFVSKNKTAFKKAKGEPNVSFFKENLLVKAGVHRASRVKENFVKGGVGFFRYFNEFFLSFFGFFGFFFVRVFFA